MNKQTIQFVRALIGAMILTVTAVWAPGVMGTEPENEVVIEHQHTRLMHFEGLKRIDIGNPEVIKVTTEPGSTHFILVGANPGRTDITLWGNDNRTRRYLVRVTGNPRVVERRDLIFQLAHLKGVVVEQIDDQFYVDGELESSRDYETLQGIIARYDNVQSNLFAPEFDVKPAVRMRARYLEINSNALRDIGIAWNEVTSGPFFGVIRRFSGSPFVVNVNVNSEAPSEQHYSGINATGNSTINMLMKTGHARVLKEQSLLVDSGSRGKVFTGGEFPSTARDENGQVVTEYRPYGLTLEMEPRVNGKEQIKTRVRLEMSSLDWSFGGGGRPNPATRKTETVTELTFNNGEAVIVSNLISKDDAKHVVKVPGLGSIPVFGELFKSRKFQNSSSELYLVLEPVIVSSSTDNGASQMAFFADRADQALGNTTFKLLD